MSPRVVLASTSTYRAALLHRLLPTFQQRAPGTDEAANASETPTARAARLACAKATDVARQCLGTIVIGSDQVASLDGVILHKPGDAATAREQLARSSARTVMFHTAVCVIGSNGQAHADSDITRVHFRALDAGTIARYVAAEQPLDCAGSFKCEGLGIALFERIDTTDPTALIGLPLIATARLLRACGITLP